MIAEKRYFDDISLNSKLIDDNAETFSFLGDDEINTNGESISEYDLDASMRTAERYKRQAISDQTEATKSNRELYFESLQFDQSGSDEDMPNTNKGRRKNKNNNRGGASSSGRGSKDDDEDKKEPHLDRLLKDIRTKVKDSKKFWSNLPYQICNNEEIAASPTNDMNCWNGMKVDK